MDTTTSDSGASKDAQPEKNEAVAEQTTDDSQSADDSQATSADDQQSAEAVEATDDSSESTETDTQAPSDSEELKSWADKKGLEVNFDNPNEIKLAQMQLNAEKKMHEATQKPVVQPPQEIEATGDESVDQLVDRQNQLELKQYVRDWFDANPDAKDHRTELQEISANRPWLNNMDDVYAHFLANPSREAELKKAGGKEALTNLAQKQQAIPPSANATSKGDFSSSKITPDNVEQLVTENDSNWYESNREEILRASGLAN